MKNKGMKGSCGTTRQGVRDLSHLKGKSVGRKVELPPDTICDHKRMSSQDQFGNTRCLMCGQCWDWDGHTF